MSDIKLLDFQESIVEDCMKSFKKYNKAAVLLYMSGGKSFIAKTVIDRLKKKKETYNVLWIADTKSIINAKHIVEDDSIKYVSFTSLSFDEKYIDYLNIKHIDLIIIDEAHKALAPKTYLGISYILNKFKRAKLLVMTATQKRYSDSKNTFKKLVPELKLGVDFYDYSLKYAIDNELTCEVNYKSCDLEVITNYANAIKELINYSKVYKEYEGLIDEAKEVVYRYTVDAYTTIGKLIKSELIYDGKQGDRWFIFYRTVQEIRENVGNIKKMFTEIYGKDININIIEFHYNIEDTNSIVGRLNESPKENTVDIIVTCNMGTSSLHPENVRGIIQFRKTKSDNIQEQQIGRGLKPKEFSDGCLYVYDLVNNKNNIDNNIKSNEDVESDTISKIRDVFNTGDKYSKFLNNLENQYGKAINIEFMDENIEELMEKFEFIKVMFNDFYKMDSCDLVFKRIIGKDYKQLTGYNPVALLENFEKSNNEDTSLSKWFQELQFRFLQGYYGEQFANKEYPEDSVYSHLWNKFGYFLYLTPDANKLNDYKLSKLIDIANKVKEYEFNYKDRISKTKELKQDISNLRMIYLSGDLPLSLAIFCKRNLIDIFGEQSDLISLVLNNHDSHKHTKLISDFKELNRVLNKVDINNEEKIIRAIALEQIFYVNYFRNPLGIQAITAIRIKHEEKLNSVKIKDETYNRAAKIIKALKYLKIDGCIKAEEDETTILNLVKRNEIDNLSFYELTVLDLMGISTFNTDGKINSHKDANIRKIMDYTIFGKTYNEFMLTHDIKLYDKLLKYKYENVPMYIQKKLNTRDWKNLKTQVEKDKLLDVNNADIETTVKNMFIIDDESTYKIKEAIRRNIIDPRVLVKYSIPYKYQIYIDDYIHNGYKNMSDKNKRGLVKFIKTTDCGFDYILENLLKIGVIPNNQVKFVESMIKLAREDKN